MSMPNSSSLSLSDKEGVEPKHLQDASNKIVVGQSEKSEPSESAEPVEFTEPAESTDPGVPPEDSPYGWVLTFACCVLFMFCLGPTNSYGVYLQEYHTHVFPTTPTTTLS
ncbi:hypothetical protein LPJ53_002658 [Coemansia erecta]|uniref:Uncharacterized protein n=1 Tax=Coemansia erecta TaxID=147472 RepID=A0A9W7Y1U3_9FUNG|nr:hypothetical protein LPJ53_002658 [Coemansia erecta]